MISSMLDLPPRGNYFAEPEYLEHDLKSGTIRNRAGAPMLALADEVVLATLNVLDRELGTAAGGVVTSMGRDWGQRAATQFSAEMEAFYGKPLSQLPLSLFTANLVEAFHHHGWGAVRIDFSRYAQGLVSVDVRNAFVGGVVKSSNTPSDGLFAAFLGGLFSRFAGMELACVQMDRGRFLLTVPERSVGIEKLRAAGRTSVEIFEELCR